MFNYFNFFFSSIFRPGSVRVDFTIYFQREIKTKDNFPDSVSRLLVAAFTRTKLLFAIDPDSIYVIVPGKNFSNAIL